MLDGKNHQYIPVHINAIQQVLLNVCPRIVLPRLSRGGGRKETSRGMDALIWGRNVAAPRTAAHAESKARIGACFCSWGYGVGRGAGRWELSWAAVPCASSGKQWGGGSLGEVGHNSKAEQGQEGPFFLQNIS